MHLSTSLNLSHSMPSGCPNRQLEHSGVNKLFNHFHSFVKGKSCRLSPCELSIHHLHCGICPLGLIANLLQIFFGVEVIFYQKHSTTKIVVPPSLAFVGKHLLPAPASVTRAAVSKLPASANIHTTLSYNRCLSWRGGWCRRAPHTGQPPQNGCTMPRRQAGCRCTSSTISNEYTVSGD